MLNLFKNKYQMLCCVKARSNRKENISLASLAFRVIYKKLYGSSVAFLYKLIIACCHKQHLLRPQYLQSLPCSLICKHILGYVFPYDRTYCFIHLRSSYGAYHLMSASYVQLMQQTTLACKFWSIGHIINNSENRG